MHIVILEDVSKSLWEMHIPHSPVLSWNLQSYRIKTDCVRYWIVSELTFTSYDDRFPTRYLTYMFSVFVFDEK